MRNKWRWIAGGIVALLFVVLLVWVVKAYTGKEAPVVRPAEQEAAPAEMVILKTVGIGNVGELIAYVSTPGKGSLTWYGADDNIISGTDTWDNGTTGDIGMMPIPGSETRGTYPILTTPFGEEKGDSIE